MICLTQAALGGAGGDGRWPAALLFWLLWSCRSDAAGVRVIADVFTPSPFDSPRVSLGLVSPARRRRRWAWWGRCPAASSRPRPRPLSQCLPAATLLHGLDAVVWAARAGRPAASSRVCSVQGDAVTLLLTQLLWTWWGRHGCASVHATPVLHWWEWADGEDNNVINNSKQLSAQICTPHLKSFCSPKTVLVWVSCGSTLKSVSSMTNSVTIADPVCVTETPLLLAHVQRGSADQAGARRDLTMAWVRQIITRFP